MRKVKAVVAAVAAKAASQQFEVRSQKLQIKKARHGISGAWLFLILERAAYRTQSRYKSGIGASLDFDTEYSVWTLNFDAAIPTLYAIIAQSGPKWSTLVLPCNFLNSLARPSTTIDGAKWGSEQVFLATMIRITKEADYGLILMLELARTTGERRPAKGLAISNGLPAPMASKILKQLNRSSLVESFRGVQGGYTLSRPAEEISVVDVIQALDGPIALTECALGPASDCDHGEHCPTRGHWHWINAAIKETLDGITLADLLQSPNTMAQSQKRPTHAVTVPLHLVLDQDAQ